MSKEGISTPLGTKMSGASLAIVFNGLYMPSKMFSIIPFSN
jgi:hypothetical protein